MNVFINFLQLLAQSYVVDAVKFLPVAEFAFSSVMELAELCFVPFRWWDMWLFVMMTPWIHIGLVLLLFGGRMLWRVVHRRVRHSERPCHEPNEATTTAPSVSDEALGGTSSKLAATLKFVRGSEHSTERRRVSAAVNTVQAIIQLIFFNNLQIAKACLVMFACVNVFGVNVAYGSYSFVCGSTLHGVSIALSVVWLSLFCIALPVLLLVAIVLPVQKQPRWMQRVLDLRFMTEDFRHSYRWWN